MIKASELITNPDGSIYHLKLLPHEISDTIITVGDQDRVEEVSKHFDKIHFQKSSREFCTHTGELDGKLITVVSTGIGTDNIDIVFNELDALVNVDLESRKVKEQIKPLTFIRIGTSGCLNGSIPVDSFLFSASAVGLDGLASFYPSRKPDRSLEAALKEQLIKLGVALPNLYHQKADSRLLNHFKGDHFTGTTLTCPGFYGPQGRTIRLKNIMSPILDNLSADAFSGLSFTNFEMETAGIYLMANLLGHRALSCNALLANRASGVFSEKPKQVVNDLIEYCLSKIINL